MVLGDSFSLYTALDAKRDTYTLRQLILSFFPELSEKNQEALLLKISTMYIGFSLDTKEFSLVVEGNFPALLKSQLNKKNGWEKKRYSPESVGLAQNFFLHTDGIALAFVHKNLLFISNNQIEAMLERFSLTNRIAIPGGIEGISNEDYNYLKLRQALQEETILLYIKEPKTLLSQFLPFDSDLALDYMLVYAEEKERDYSLTIDFVFTDKRAVRPALLLFKIAFYNYDVFIEQIAENQVQVKNISFNLWDGIQ